MLINYQYARRQNFCCMQSRAAQVGLARSCAKLTNCTNTHQRTHTKAFIIFWYFLRKKKASKIELWKESQTWHTTSSNNCNNNNKGGSNCKNNNHSCVGISLLHMYVYVSFSVCMCVWLCIGWRQRNLASVLCASSSYKKGKLCGVDGGRRWAGEGGAAVANKNPEKIANRIKIAVAYAHPHPCLTYTRWLQHSHTDARSERQRSNQIVASTKAANGNSG